MYKLWKMYVPKALENFFTILRKNGANLFRFGYFGTFIFHGRQEIFGNFRFHVVVVVVPQTRNTFLPPLGVYDILLLWYAANITTYYDTIGNIFFSVLKEILHTPLNALATTISTTDR